MKSKKLSLATMLGRMSRADMKKIMAGSGETNNCSIQCFGSCTMGTGGLGTCRPNTAGTHCYCAGAS